jgi:BON domain
MKMKYESLKKLKMQVLVVAAACALSSSFVAAQDPPPAQNAAPAQDAQAGARTDGQIEMDVVHALDASDALKNDLITAATIQGEVTLSGTVASDADKQLAESISSKVTGVSKVNNKLQIGNPADDPNNVAPPQDSSAAPQDDNQQANQNPPSYSQSPDQQQQQQPAYPNDQQNNQQQAQGYPQQQQPGYGQQPGYPQQGPNGPTAPGQMAPPPGPGYAGPGGGPGYGRGYPPPPPPPGYYNQQGPRGFAIANGPVTVPQGTVLTLRTNESLDEKHAKDGQPVDFVGATVHGVVTESKRAGALTGSPELALAVTSLDIDGRTYPLQSDQFRVKGPSKTGRTVGNAIGGALVGALIGGAVGGGSGAAIGAGVGGAGGTAASAAGGPHAWIPAEALVTFHLNGPVTVDPVSRDEANRLAQGLFQGGPELYRRGYYRPGYPPPPGYYGGYPQVYYRPYVFEGGYYYWR